MFNVQWCVNFFVFFFSLWNALNGRENVVPLLNSNLSQMGLADLVSEFVPSLISEMSPSSCW